MLRSIDFIPSAVVCPWRVWRSRQKFLKFTAESSSPQWLHFFSCATFSFCILFFHLLTLLCIYCEFFSNIQQPQYDFAQVKYQYVHLSVSSFFFFLLYSFFFPPATFLVLTPICPGFSPGQLQNCLSKTSPCHPLYLLSSFIIYPLSLLGLQISESRGFLFLSLLPPSCGAFSAIVTK